MHLLTMGWRNVLRNRRRSVVTILAMAFALFAEVLYSGLIPGYMQNLEEDVVDLEFGDVQVFAPGFRENPSLFAHIEDPDALLRGLEAAGLPAAPRLLGGGLAASGIRSAGVSLRGVDLVREPAVSRIAGKVDQGSWLDPSDPRGVVLGRQLARTLCASPGAELVVLTQAADGSMANDLFTVRGVLLGIAEGTDRSAVFLPADTFRDLMALPDGAHQVVVRRGAMDLDAAAAAVRGLAPGLEVKTWRELAPILGQMMDSTRGLVLIFLFVIYVAVGILVLNAMLMAVFERIREFGVLKAIGAGPLRVFGLILVESSIQTFAATVLGLAAAAPFMALLSTRGVDVGVLGGVDAMGIAMRPVWHGIYGPEALATPVVMLWAIVGLAVAWPALKAAWIDPVRAMHHH